MVPPPDRYYTPRRDRHMIRHRFCCIAAGHPPGWCNAQPFRDTGGKRRSRTDAPQRQKKRPYPDGGFEPQVILEADLEYGIAFAGLTGAEYTAIRLLSREWLYLDNERPAMQFSRREYADLLRSACNKIATALGALAEAEAETPRQDGPLIMIRVGEAAALLNISKPLVRDYCEAGLLRAVRERTEWRIDRASVLGFWERRLGQVL